MLLLLAARDFFVWTLTLALREAKTVLRSPALARGDGPVPAFRAWFRRRFEVSCTDKWKYAIKPLSRNQQRFTQQSDYRFGNRTHLHIQPHTKAGAASFEHEARRAALATALADGW